MASQLTPSAARDPASPAHPPGLADPSLPRAPSSLERKAIDLRNRERKHLAHASYQPLPGRGLCQPECSLQRHRDLFQDRRLSSRARAGLGAAAWESRPEAVV